MARKIIYYVSVSADGFIARPDGAVDWLDRPRPKGDYGMGKFYKSVDTCLFGGKTYRFAVAHGVKDGCPGKKTYVFSRTLKPPRGAQVEMVAEDPKRFARRLRAQKGKHIWLMGGAELAASFFDAGELDELVIHVVPVLIGEGIPLLAARHRNVPLKLLRTKKFPDGVILQHYSVGG